MADETGLDWVEANFKELRATYPGEWIAVVDEQVIAHAPSGKELRELLINMHVYAPFIKRIPPPDEQPPFFFRIGQHLTLPQAVRSQEEIYENILLRQDNARGREADYWRSFDDEEA